MQSKKGKKSVYEKAEMLAKPVILLHVHGKWIRRINLVFCSTSNE